MPQRSYSLKRFLPGAGRQLKASSDEISPQAVETLELEDGSVTNDKLAGGITNDKLAGSITNANLAGGITNVKLAGGITDDKLDSYIVKDPGVYAVGWLRLAGDYVAGDTFTIGTDVFLIDPITHNSGDTCKNGDWNSITDPLVFNVYNTDYPGITGANQVLAGDLLYIGTEYLRCLDSISDGTITSFIFRRGACGSTKAVHANGVAIKDSATRPTGKIDVGVQAAFGVAVVTPKLVSTINEPAGEPNQSQLVSAKAMDANTSVFIVGKIPALLALATTQVSAKGIWDAAMMGRGRAAGVRCIYREAVVPTVSEVSAGYVLLPMSFTPATVLVRVVVTAGGAELTDITGTIRWDGTMTIVAASGLMPAYVSLGVGSAVPFDPACTLEVFAIE
jgi:hypothetical protein